MTAKGEDQILRSLDQLRVEMAEQGSQYSKQPRRDWARIVMAAIGVAGALAAVGMFLFKTNAAADLEHATMGGDRAQIRAEHRRDVDLQAQTLKSHSDTQSEILQKLDDLGDNQVLIGERLRVKGMRGNGDD